MKEIKTIDLWTEQFANQYVCFNGAFVDGFDKNQAPFNEYKIIKNCNCKISCEIKDVNISNKHNAIVFYKNGRPVRLLVANLETDIQKCIQVALDQFFGNGKLKDVFEKKKIKHLEIDLKEKPVSNGADKKNEIDVGSCDRFALLYNMLKGSYTESETKYGNFQSDTYEFLPNVNICYDLLLQDEHFVISHKCAFINNIKTRIIPIQEHANFTKK